MDLKLPVRNAMLDPSFRPGDGEDAYGKEYAKWEDEHDSLRHFREEFVIPSKEDLKRKRLSITDEDLSSPRCIYLCGNSLGLQPRNIRKYIDQYLRAWATKGVTGHFVSHEDSLLPPFVDFDSAGSQMLAPLVGASPNEVAVMGTLTANLHILMASFYRPNEERYKIIIEGKAFPSDHYAVESQIRCHDLDPEDAMVLIEPEDADRPILRTEQILQVIDDNASRAVLVILPAIQYYTGQYFDIERITTHAHSKGLFIGWDCAHAVGNVDLQLHGWDVDFAVWCHYKYVNSGPGAMGGLFVHERHGEVSMVVNKNEAQYRPRLTGWWGHDKSTRFLMDNKFVPQPGAAGYQLSNPSVLDLSAVTASLHIFNQTSMGELRQKSLKLTGYLERLLLNYNAELPSEDKLFTIITPSNPEQRGAQLSLFLRPGLLDHVLKILEENGVVVDERKPDVIRVSPAPLYNSYTDVWEFCRIFHQACQEAADVKNMN